MSIQVHQLDGTGTLHDVSNRFERGLYPGGEPWVKLPVPTGVFNVRTLVTARIRSLVDLGYFHETVACLRTAGVKEEIYAFLPYLPAARSDRTATEGVVMPRGLDLYVTVLNSLDLMRVFTIDVHSPVSEALVDGLVNLSSIPAIKAHVENLAELPGYKGQEYVAIIAPDHGALDRARLAAIELDLPVFHAEKVRDMATGKLTGFRPPGDVPRGRSLLVDDICDGGGTFAGLLNVLRNRYPHYHAWDLFVTHGIFSGYASENLEGFGRVLTTQSYKPQEPPYRTVPLSVWAEPILKEMTK